MRTSYKINQSIELISDKMSALDIFMIKDEESDYQSRKTDLDFQVNCGGYFANLATILDLIAQDKEVFKSKKYLSLLKRIKDDLMYLQKHYEIMRRPYGE